MTNIFTIWILTSLWCFTSGTNETYSAEASAKEDMFGMVLSAETNFLKSGVWINNTNHIIVVRNGQVIERATLAMLNLSTNQINFWWFWPSTDLQYQIKLIDDGGNEVPKTAYGKRFGRAPTRNPSNAWAVDAQNFGLHGWAILPKGDILPEFFANDPVKSLPKCFEIKRPGNYRLTLNHHIFMSETRSNGVFLKEIAFSPVTIDVLVTSVDK